MEVLLVLVLILAACVCLMRAADTFDEFLVQKRYARRYRTEGAGRPTDPEAAKAAREWLDSRHRMR